MGRGRRTAVGDDDVPVAGRGKDLAAAAEGLGAAVADIGGHVGDIPAGGGDLVVVVVADADGRVERLAAVDADSADAGAGAGDAVADDPVQVVEAGVDEGCGHLAVAFVAAEGAGGRLTTLEGVAGGDGGGLGDVCLGVFVLGHLGVDGKVGVFLLDLDLDVLGPRVLALYHV